jgi:hypothetical protein
MAGVCRPEQSLQQHRQQQQPVGGVYAGAQGVTGALLVVGVGAAAAAAAARVRELLGRMRRILTVTVWMLTGAGGCGRGLPLNWRYLPPPLLLLVLLLLPLLLVEGRCCRYSSSSQAANSCSSSSRCGLQGVTAVQPLQQQQPRQLCWILGDSLSPVFRSGC